MPATRDRFVDPLWPAVCPLRMRRDEQMSRPEWKPGDWFVRMPTSASLPASITSHRIREVTPDGTLVWSCLPEWDKSGSIGDLCVPGADVAHAKRCPKCEAAGVFTFLIENWRFDPPPMVRPRRSRKWLNEKAKEDQKRYDAARVVMKSVQEEIRDADKHAMETLLQPIVNEADRAARGDQYAQQIGPGIRLIRLKIAPQGS